MKASELMIGDLVSNGNRNVRVIGNTGTYITSEYETHNGRVVQCLFEEDIKLIPLTDEILKKNGYETLYCVTGEITGEEYFCINGMTTHRLANGYYSVGLNLGKKIIIEYVHELQNLLRLIKENDIADNFKI